MDWILWNQISQLTNVYQSIDKNILFIQNLLENKENVSPTKKKNMQKLLIKTKKKFLLYFERFIEHYILTRANVSYILTCINTLELDII